MCGAAVGFVIGGGLYKVNINHWLIVYNLEIELKSSVTWQPYKFLFRCRLVASFYRLL